MEDLSNIDASITDNFQASTMSISETKRNAENDQENSNGTIRIVERVKNPMRLSPVIRCILKYLSIPDIKNCRYISEEWNILAQPILGAHSVINFFNNKTDLANDLRFTPSKFLELFSDSLKNFPFTKFRIHSDYQWSWTVKELSTFFEYQQKSIRELEMNELCLEHEHGMHCFDISPWISRSRMAIEDTQHHSKFTFGNWEHSKLRAVVQNSILTNIKELSLNNCQIQLQDDVKLHPIKFSLCTVSFFKNGNKLNELCVNDILDFSRLKHLSLERHYGTTGFTKLILDLSGKVNLEYLRLRNIKMRNWKTCEWNVNRFDLYEHPFTEKTKMKIQELNTGAFYSIDISVLPQSLEKLTLCLVQKRYFPCNRNIILKNLQHLSMTIPDRGCSFIISYFIECPKLLELELEGGVSNDLEINSEWIPKSVKNLKMERVKVNLMEGRTGFQFERLTLIEYSFGELRKNINFLIQSKELVLGCPEEAETNESLTHLLECIKSCSDYCKYIYVGPFSWDSYLFEQSPLVEYVDKKAKYYIFESQKGKALDTRNADIFPYP